MTSVVSAGPRWWAGLRYSRLSVEVSRPPGRARCCSGRRRRTPLFWERLSPEHGSGTQYRDYLDLRLGRERQVAVCGCIAPTFALAPGPRPGCRSRSATPAASIEMPPARAYAPL